MSSARRLHRVTFALALGAGLPIPLLRAQTNHPPKSPGIDLAGMNRSVKPGDDFFAYANGAWLEKGSRLRLFIEDVGEIEHSIV